MSSSNNKIADLQRENNELRRRIEELTSPSSVETCQTQLKTCIELAGFIVKHNPNAIAVFDNDIKYMYVSDRYLRDFGIKGDITGTYHYDVFPELPEEIREVHRRALNGEVISNEDDMFVDRNGNTQYSRWECRPWYDAEGNIGGFITYTEITTERRNAEKYLRQSKAKLRSIVENANGSLWAIDRDYRLISSNRHFRNQFEISFGKAAEIGQSVLFDGLSDDVRQKWKTLYDRALSGESFNIEIKRVHAPSEVWSEYRFGPIVNCESRVEGVSVFSTDINARKQAELKLKNLNLDLELAQRIANIGNWCFDPEVGTPVWSDVIYDIYERDPIKGPPTLEDYRDIYEGKWFDVFRYAIDAAINKGKPYDIVLRLNLPSGNIKWIHAICQPEEKPGPKGYRLHGTIQDITEIKNAEQEVRDQQKKTEKLLGGLPDMVYIYSTKRGAIYWSEKVSDILGFNPDELIINPYRWRNSILPEYTEEVEKAIKQDNYDIQYQIRDNTGNIHWLRDRAFNIEQKGDERIIYGIATDITSEHALLEDIKRSNELLKTAEELAGLGSWELEVHTDRWTLSDNWRSLHGIEMNEFDSISLLEIAPEEDKPKIEEAFRTAMKDGCYDIEHRIIRKNTGEIRDVRAYGRVIFDIHGKPSIMRGIVIDITEQKKADRKREELIEDLQSALAHVKTLKGLIPICASCKKIRDDDGYWHQVESYIKEHSEATFSHGICPDCMQELYPGLAKDDED